MFGRVSPTALHHVIAKCFSPSRFGAFVTVSYESLTSFSRISPSLQLENTRETLNHLFFARRTRITGNCQLTMFNPSLLFFFLIFFSLCHDFIQSTVHRGLGHADDRKNLTLDNNVWDLEYSKGDWSYLATNPLERSRLGIIYSSFYQTMANKNHLLDVGCGEGALSDLFLGPNAHHYHGIDVSKVAIEKAKIKRPHFDFAHANAMDYKPAGPVTKFKMIVLVKWSIILITKLCYPIMPTITSNRMERLSFQVILLLPSLPTNHTSTPLE